MVFAHRFIGQFSKALALFFCGMLINPLSACAQPATESRAEQIISLIPLIPSADGIFAYNGHSVTTVDSFRISGNHRAMLLFVNISRLLAGGNTEDDSRISRMLSEPDNVGENTYIDGAIHVVAVNANPGSLVEIATDEQTVQVSVKINGSTQPITRFAFPVLDSGLAVIGLSPEFKLGSRAQGYLQPYRASRYGTRVYCRSNDEGNTIALIVPGANPGLTLIDWMREEMPDIQPQEVFDYPRQSSMVDVSKKLAEYVKERLAQCPASRIMIISHSQGAHVASYMLWTDPDLRNQSDRLKVITIDPAVREFPYCEGCPTEAFERGIWPSAPEMRPGSPIDRTTQRPHPDEDRIERPRITPPRWRPWDSRPAYDYTRNDFPDHNPFPKKKRLLKKNQDFLRTIRETIEKRYRELVWS